MMPKNYTLSLRTAYCLDSQFQDRICRKYHFAVGDKALLSRVCKDIFSCIKNAEMAEIHSYEGETAYVDVLYTLGPQVDLLVSKYGTENNVQKQIMAEYILSEIMRIAYEKIEEEIQKQTGRCLKEYHFWGEEAYPLEEMPEILASFGHARVRWNKDSSMSPSKSVLYRGILGGRGEKQRGNTHICSSCQKYKTGQCPFSR